MFLKAIAVLITMTWLSMTNVLSEMSDMERYFWYYSGKHQKICQPKGQCSEQLTTTGNWEFEGAEEEEVRQECCGRCSCEPDCYDFGNCCMGMYDSFQHGIHVLSTTRYECVKLQYLSDTKSDYYDSLWYWMVTQCPADDTNVEDRDRQLCEHPGFDGNLESLQPVSDLSESTHFMNKYCAFCNGRFDISPHKEWELEIYCNDFISLADANLLNTIEDKRCNILYKPPSSAILQVCDRSTQYTISTCNATGKWNAYDKFIEMACNSFADPFNQTYKNYFCMLCNTRANLQISKDSKCDTDFDKIISVSPPFFAILDVNLWKGLTGDTPKLNCDTKTQFEDTKMVKCRDILCDKPLHLEDATTCEMSVVDITLHLCYELFIKMTPTENISIGADAVDKNMIYTMFPNVRHMQLLFRDSLIAAKLNYFLAHMVLYADARSVEDIGNMHNRILPLNISGKQVDVRVNIGIYNVSEYSLYDDVFVTEQEDTSRVDIFRTKFTEPAYGTLICPPDISFKFNKLLRCPFIRLDFDELPVSTENDFLIVRKKSFILKSFSKWEYRLDAGGIFICLDDYFLIYNALPDAAVLRRIETSVEQIGPKRILSFICVCLSLMCLLVTIMVYGRFSELRSQPGVNNLILCVCLLCAQSVYQFAAGQQSHSHVSCSVVGALCHLLWLAVMFSLNSCSLQMFMIFRSHTKLLSKCDAKTTLITILYIIGSSLLIVLINIMVSLIRSSGKDIGYSGNVCFLNSYEMHLVTFIIPSFILITANLCFFIFVVYRMREFNLISSRLNQERSYLKINARLSTLTGLTWMFGFLQILVRSDILEYLFIILNASQGVFIMVAFICNRRVYFLLFKRPTTMPSDGAVVTKQSSIPN